MHYLKVIAATAREKHFDFSSMYYKTSDILYKLSPLDFDSYYLYDSTKFTKASNDKMKALDELMIRVLANDADHNHGYLMQEITKIQDISFYKKLWNKIKSTCRSRATSLRILKEETKEKYDTLRHLLQDLESIKEHERDTLHKYSMLKEDIFDDYEEYFICKAEHLLPYIREHIEEIKHWEFEGLRRQEESTLFDDVHQCNKYENELEMYKKDYDHKKDQLLSYLKENTEQIKTFKLTSFNHKIFRALGEYRLGITKDFTGSRNRILQLNRKPNTLINYAQFLNSQGKLLPLIMQDTSGIVMKFVLLYIGLDKILIPVTLFNTWS